MTFENRFIPDGRRQVWQYNGGCEYDCIYHRGKVEGHHPVSSSQMLLSTYAKRTTA